MTLIVGHSVSSRVAGGWIGHFAQWWHGTVAPRLCCTQAEGSPDLAAGPRGCRHPHRCSSRITYKTHGSQDAPRALSRGLGAAANTAPRAQELPPEPGCLYPMHGKPHALGEGQCRHMLRPMLQPGGSEGPSGAETLTQSQGLLGMAPVLVHSCLWTFAQLEPRCPLPFALSLSLHQGRNLQPRVNCWPHMPETPSLQGRSAPVLPATTMEMKSSEPELALN